MSNSLVTPWTIAHQAPLSIGFPRQEYWSGLPFPSPGDCPDPAIKRASPAWQADSLPLSHLGRTFFFFFGGEGLWFYTCFEISQNLDYFLEKKKPSPSYRQEIDGNSWANNFLHIYANDSQLHHQPQKDSWNLNIKQQKDMVLINHL